MESLSLVGIMSAVTAEIVIGVAFLSLTATINRNINQTGKIMAAQIIARQVANAITRRREM